jgi:hypothetical protein
MKSKNWIWTALATLLTVTLLPLNAATATQTLPIVGDTGPGGGKIIYVSSTPFSCGPTGSGSCDALEWGNANDLLANAQSNGGSNVLFLQQVSVSHESDPVGVNARDGQIGEGYKNTMAWVEQNGVYNSVTNNYAAGKVRALTIGGKTDWYLANAAELAVLYSYVSTYLPRFLDLWYMDSSSEVDAENYVGWWFGTGNANGAGPNAKSSGGNNGLAAIRAFSADEAAVAAAAQTPAVSEAQAKAAAAVAAAKREAEVKTARADIAKTLEKADNLTADSFAKAEIAGVTSENIAQVQAEILALPAELRTDINQVLKVARKFEVVGKIAGEQMVTLPITAFVEVGLIPADSKNKVALIAAIRRASTDTRDSFADIQAVIAAEAARIQDRKDRLAATLARLKSK